MTLWLNAQLPPHLAGWIEQTLEISAIALRDIGRRDATDRAIFDAARNADAVLISKDSDFVELVMRLGAPLKLIWLHRLTAFRCHTNHKPKQYGSLKRVLLKLAERRRGCESTRQQDRHQVKASKRDFPSGTQLRKVLRSLRL
jgi:predicted nuclease of predicted toxin-antitoxin system